jgi:hypothetical protein
VPRRCVPIQVSGVEESDSRRCGPPLCYTITVRIGTGRTTEWADHMAPNEPPPSPFGTHHTEASP